LRHTVVGTGAQVGDHHETHDGGQLAGIDGADGSIPVHGIGTCGIPAAGTGGEHDCVVPSDHLGDLGPGESFHIGDDGARSGGFDVCGVVGVADHGGDFVTAGGEQGGKLAGDLPVPADDGDTTHASTLPPPRPASGRSATTDAYPHAPLTPVPTAHWCPYPPPTDARLSADSVGEARKIGIRTRRSYSPSSQPTQHSRRARTPHRRRRTAAQRVSSCREESCSLRSTAETWVSTVLMEMNSSLATSR